MASRREEQERRRAERLAAEQRESQSAQRRLLAGYIAAGALTVAIVAGLVIVLLSGGSDGAPGTDSDEFPANAHIQGLSGSANDFEPDDREGTPPASLQQGDLEQAAEAADCELQLNLEDEGSTHIGSDPSKAPDYATNPATSGDHVDPGFQQADGAYLETPDPAYVVHSLEHGRVAIQYSSQLSQDDQLAIKGVFDESPAGAVLFPNDDMRYEVAVTAWTQMVGCDTYEGDATLDVIRDFRDIYRGHGPEPVALVTG